MHKMLTDNTIELAQTQWGLTAVFAPKEGGTIRFCVDYRKLNKLIKKDLYPILRMDDKINFLLKSPYSQHWMQTDHIDKSR